VRKCTYALIATVGILISSVLIAVIFKLRFLWRETVTASCDALDERGAGC